MRHPLIVFIFGLVLFRHSNADFVVAGYLPDYRAYINVNNTATLLTDLILFSIDPKVGSSGVVNLDVGQCCLDQSHYRLAREARKHRDHFHATPLKLWVSIGGAGRSSGFKEIVETKSNQLSFIRKAIELCKRELLDGIDLDWEGISDQEEYVKYLNFVVLVAAAFHKEKLLLSVTTRSNLSPVVVENIDRINFMAYDLLFQNGPKHHASYKVITNMLDEWLAAGYPPEKIVLGIPGYGRHKSNPSLVKTYAELVDDGLDDTSVSEWKGFLFDSPKRIQQKLGYVKKNGLGGVFLWELGHDKQHDLAPGGVLLQAAAEVRELKDEL